MPTTAPDIERAIRNIPDFPKAGIQFKDITPVLSDARLFSGCIDLLVDGLKPPSLLDLLSEPQKSANC